MKNLLTAAAVSVVLFSSCSHISYSSASTARVQDQMREVDKTDYAKVENNHKDKVEGKRQNRYHAYANETDKKLNHQKNDQINKKKVPDTEFSFY